MVERHGLNMNIFYKCSFKSSNGYKVAKCSTDTYSLILLNESKHGTREEFPETIRSTLFYNLGRSMVLATDEKGDYFLGVYNLIEGDYEKYVNVIFTDPDYMKIARLFSFLCKLYKDGKIKLQKTIKRISPREDGLEYEVVREEIDKLIKVTENESVIIEKCSKPRKLIAFVTEDSYMDYYEKLVENCKLDVKDAVVKEQENAALEKINLQLKPVERKNHKIIIFIIAVVLFILFCCNR